MNSTTHPESRQARRWRKRQHPTRPTPAPRTPYLLLCRCWTVAEAQ